jgi:DNA-binding NtrC family response regulator
MNSKLILVVDDEPMVQNLCSAILRSRGFDALIESNGLDGLKAYRERHREICLVLSDVSMPFMGGVEMAREMFEVCSHANVILMSGGNLSDIVPADVRRLCSLIQKPFLPAQLMEAVMKCLKYDTEHHAEAASA